MTERHSCDREIRRNTWAMHSSQRQTGHEWTCSCGQRYQFVDDEAEGGAWWPVERKGAYIETYD